MWYINTMITFKKDTTLTVITDFDETNDNILNELEDIFEEGEKVDATIINEETHKGEAYVDLQFADGSMALGVLRENFEVL